jgi:hypothetical protein
VISTTKYTSMYTCSLCKNPNMLSHELMPFLN